jgi:hypothetical protein
MVKNEIWAKKEGNRRNNKELSEEKGIRRQESKNKGETEEEVG